MADYYSDRVNGPRTMLTEGITPLVWRGVAAEIGNRHAENSFSIDFPHRGCPDGEDITGTDEAKLRDTLLAEIPDLWPFWKSNRERQRTPPGFPFLAEPEQDSDDTSLPGTLTEIIDINTCPPTHVMMDLIEFVYRRVTKVQVSWHSYFRHDHIDQHDRRGAQTAFREQVNLIFKRNGVAFRFTNDGLIERIAPEPLEDLLQTPIRSGDSELDRFLAQAIRNFRGHAPESREYALRDLWHAWERAKTLMPGEKKQSTLALIERAARDQKIRTLLDEDARRLTAAGNQFSIRHSETSQTKLETVQQQDYLFHSMFALLWALLTSR